MFPQEIEELIDAKSTPFNPKLAKGLASFDLKDSVKFIDRVLRSVARGFPDDVKYLGYRSLTPQEEFAITTRKRTGPEQFDIAQSNIWMTCYQFSFQGTPIDKPLYLLYCDAAGKTVLSDSKFLISPVAADRVFSIMLDHVFIRLLKAKLIVKQLPYQWVNGGVRDAAQVVWADIYKEKASAEGAQSKVKANTTLAHYLFCKYGLKRTFKQFAGATIVVGTSAEINADAYPRDTWSIHASSQVKPRGHKTFYEPSDFRVAIRHTEVTMFVKNLLAGLFYVVDHFPQRMTPKLSEDKDLWMVLLGKLIWGTDSHEGKLLTNVQNHFSSLDHYVDELTNDKLRSISVITSDVYELFAFVISHMNEWLRHSARHVNSMWGKELVVLPYVYYNIIEAIHLMYFKLNANQYRELTLKRVKRAFDILKPGTIYKISRGHGEVTTTSCPGDNPATRMTAIMVPQAQSITGAGKLERTSVTDPARRTHPSTIDVGSHKALPKANPAGNARVNMTALLDPQGRLIRDPKFINFFDQAEEFFARN